MNTSTLHSMIAWTEDWLPTWRKGRRFGYLRLAVEDIRVYCYRWPSRDAFDRLDYLLGLMVSLEASTVEICRTARGRVPLHVV